MRSSATPGASPTRRRFFALAALLLPFLLLLLLEGGLRLFGFGQSNPLFVPVPGAPDYLRDNHEVVRRFVANPNQAPRLWLRPVFFRRDKTPEIFRIFVQGGSSAEGYPYGYGASPAGMLQHRLQRTFPERKIEVVTTAMSAVTSYTLLDFSNEILEQAPDAIVIYAGHNEYVGLLGVGSGYSIGRNRLLVLAFLWARDLRIFQLVQRAISVLTPATAKTQGRRNLMATIVAERKIPYGSSLYRRGLEQYRANLRALLRRYRHSGVPVFIGTVVSNERDQAPFISGHGPGVDVEAWDRYRELGQRALDAGDAVGALRAFDQAVNIDDAYAEGHFWRGRALEALGRYRDARDAYLAAKDRDELRFRAPEEINRIIREVATEQGAQVVDVQQRFVEAARNGIVGEDLMLEHLHPNLDGYFIIADAFYEAIRNRGLIGHWERPVSSELARTEIPVTEVDRLYGEYRIKGLMSDWPFGQGGGKQYRPPRPKDRVEEIADRYFRGHYQWPEAMRRLLDHYRSSDNEIEAAKVAVLLAEGFPNRVEDQATAAELLSTIGRADAEIYRRRALDMQPHR